MLSGDCETVVLRKENFDPSFYELRSGLAGDILQKVSNYRSRLIILGDFSKITSRSLKDFIFESNKRGKVIFKKTLEEAVELIR